jgi:4-amino-4-deoxy-L-arabinose transferase-like glycosyltransferase
MGDTLMMLLLVLAADATSAAVKSGRGRSLVMAGVWVGLAFQAKTLQAWLVLPVPGRRPRWPRSKPTSATGSSTSPS